MWVRAGSSLRWVCRTASSSSSSALPHASARGLFAGSSARRATVQSQSDPPSSVPLEKAGTEPKQQYPVKGHEGAPKGLDGETAIGVAEPLTGTEGGGLDSEAAQELYRSLFDEEEEQLELYQSGDEEGLETAGGATIATLEPLLETYSGWPLVRKNAATEYEENLVALTSGPAFPFAPKSMGSEERERVARAGPKDEMDWALFSNAIGAIAGRADTAKTREELEMMVAALADEALPKECPAAILASVIRGLSAHLSSERLTPSALKGLEEKLQAAVEQQLKKPQLALRHCLPLAGLLGKQDSTGKAFVPEQRTLELLIEAAAKSQGRVENYTNFVDAFEGLVRLRTRGREHTSTAPDALVASAATALAKLLGPGTGMAVRVMTAFDKNERTEMLRFLAALHHLPEVGSIAGIDAALGSLSPVRWPRWTLPVGVTEATIAAAACALTRAGAWSGARVDRLLYQAIQRVPPPQEEAEEAKEAEAEPEAEAQAEAEAEAVESKEAAEGEEAGEGKGEGEGEGEAAVKEKKEVLANEMPQPEEIKEAVDPHKGAWPLWLMAIAQSGKPVSEAPNKAESLSEKNQNPEEIVLTKPLQKLLEDEGRETLTVVRTIWGLTVLGGKDEERDQLLATLASPGPGNGLCMEAWSLLLEVKQAIDSEDAPVEAFQSDYMKSGLAAIAELQGAERQRRREELEATLKAFGPEASGFEVLPSPSDGLTGAFEISTKTSGEEDAEEVKVLFDFEGLPGQYTNLALRRKAWAKQDEGLRVEPLPLSAWDAAGDTMDRILLVKRLLAGPPEAEEDDD